MFDKRPNFDNKWLEGCYRGLKVVVTWKVVCISMCIGLIGKFGCHLESRAFDGYVVGVLLLCQWRQVISWTY